MDGDLAEAELGRLGELAAALGLRSGDDAVQRAIDEVFARGCPASPEQVRRALAGMSWGALAPVDGPLLGEIAAVARQGGVEGALGVLELDHHQMAAVFADGLAVRFDDGPAFVRWTDVERYTRVPVAGAAFHLRTRDGRDHAVSDPRLRDVGALVDLVFGRQPAPRG